MKKVLLAIFSAAAQELNTINFSTWLNALLKLNLKSC